MDLENGKVTRIALGSHFYLWVPGDDVIGDDNIVVISAHGGFYPNDMFQVRRGLQFNFYCSHGQALIDPRGTSLGDRFARPAVDLIDTDALTHGAMQDYVIHKFQGRHGTPGLGVAESYDDIRDFVRDHQVCVATVRNRRSLLRRDYRGRSRKLSALYRHIERRYPRQFSTYYCSMCRSRIGGPDPFDNMRIISVRPSPVADVA